MAICTNPCTDNTQVFTYFQTIYCQNCSIDQICPGQELLTISRLAIPAECVESSEALVWCSYLLSFLVLRAHPSHHCRQNQEDPATITIWTELQTYTDTLTLQLNFLHLTYRSPRVASCTRCARISSFTLSGKKKQMLGTVSQGKKVKLIPMWIIYEARAVLLQLKIH